MDRLGILSGAVLASLALAISSSPVSAAWPTNPNVNVPLCTAASSQQTPAIAADGAGGGIVSWADFRGPSGDIYCQRVLASGMIDPNWPADGRGLCTASGTQAKPAMVSDGNGGAIVAWQDYRNTYSHVYAQHVLASGAVDPSWPANGKAICTSAIAQVYIVMASDGAGGAVVAWQDNRVGTYDIYAQHVFSTGLIDPAWPTNGRALCTAADQQQFPTIVSDGTGGAIVAWDDLRSGTGNYDIYAQHVLAGGTTDPVWPVNGRAVCTAPNNQWRPKSVSDGSGGVIVAWDDERGGTANSDVYAQHVQSGGLINSAWPANGRAICAAPDNQQYLAIVSDRVSGAIVTWQDRRSGVYLDIYAQHVLTTGLPDWQADGIPLCTATSDQYVPQIVSDDEGGAIVVWQDNRVGSYDTYAQHVLPNGLIDPEWPIDGSAVCTAAGEQVDALIISDGDAGAIVAWSDRRSVATDRDIYAQRVLDKGSLGGVPVELSKFAVE